MASPTGPLATLSPGVAAKQSGELRSETWLRHGTYLRSNQKPPAAMEHHNRMWVSRSRRGGLVARRPWIGSRIQRDSGSGPTRRPHGGPHCRWAVHLGSARSRECATPAEPRMRLWSLSSLRSQPRAMAMTRCRRGAPGSTAGGEVGPAGWGRTVRSGRARRRLTDVRLGRTIRRTTERDEARVVSRSTGDGFWSSAPEAFLVSWASWSAISGGGPKRRRSTASCSTGWATTAPRR